MEAWIVHIREEWIADEKTGRIEERNTYSAWATENQALKNVATFLKYVIDRPWDGAFIGRTELQTAVQGLMEVNKIMLAIDLINRYTIIEPRNANGSTPRKMRITITESKFLGSAFE